MTRVLIADDHEVVRRGLREILASKLGAELEVTEAQNAPETVNLLLKEDWDLVLLDINMPGGSGLEVLEQASKIRPKTPILVLTCFPEEQFAVRAFKLGASGYLTKQSASDELITAIRRILAGGKYVTATLGERLAASLGSPAEEAIHETLSQRELEVLRLVAVGKSTKEIADGLSLSDKTVMTYRTRIWEKTGLKTSVDIARYALKNGIVE